MKSRVEWRCGLTHTHTRTHAHTHIRTHTLHTRTHTQRCGPHVRPTRRTRAGVLLAAVGGTWCSKPAAAQVRTCLLGRRFYQRCVPRLLQGCNARARGSRRWHSRGEPVERARRKARATAGTHSGRGRPPARQCVEGTARGSGRAAARGPVFRKSRRPRVPSSNLDWSRARACQRILELCEWFRDCSQASGASQRVQRASAPRPTGLRCGWPCTGWPTARPQPRSCFAELDRCARAS